MVKESERESEGEEDTTAIILNRPLLSPWDPDRCYFNEAINTTELDLQMKPGN